MSEVYDKNKGNAKEKPKAKEEKKAPENTDEGNTFQAICFVSLSGDYVHASFKAIPLEVHVLNVKYQGNKRVSLPIPLQKCKLPLHA